MRGTMLLLRINSPSGSRCGQYKSFESVCGRDMDRVVIFKAATVKVRISVIFSLKNHIGCGNLYRFCIGLGPIGPITSLLGDRLQIARILVLKSISGIKAELSSYSGTIVQPSSISSKSNAISPGRRISFCFWCRLQDANR
jgi:hypothetical protein